MDESRAATAVVNAMESHQLQWLCESLPAESSDECAAAVALSMRDPSRVPGLNVERVLSFWGASSSECIERLQSLTGMSLSVASYLTGAAVNALLLGGYDLNVSQVTRLAHSAWLGEKVGAAATT